MRFLPDEVVMVDVHILTLKQANFGMRSGGECEERRNPSVICGV
jgi:hypothetical protein